MIGDKIYNSHAQDAEVKVLPEANYTNFLMWMLSRYGPNYPGAPKLAERFKAACQPGAECPYNETRCPGPEYVHSCEKCIARVRLILKDPIFDELRDQNKNSRESYLDNFPFLALGITCHSLGRLIPRSNRLLFNVLGLLVC